MCLFETGPLVSCMFLRVNRSTGILLWFDCLFPPLNLSRSAPFVRRVYIKEPRWSAVVR